MELASFGTIIKRFFYFGLGAVCTLIVLLGTPRRWLVSEAFWVGCVEGVAQAYVAGSGGFSADTLVHGYCLNRAKEIKNGQAN
jgi:hypothetical protein